MAKNSNLHNAKKQKNDEFYTQYEDIEKEIQHYNLKGMSIYSPCDDYRTSNFTKYFKDHFKGLGITKYCCTNYDIGNGAWKYEYDGENETITQLEGNGDFRSEECINFLKEADIVVTNPPFSLFREYVAQLMEYEKKFIIIGNSNAITYKEIFPLIKENKLWLGVPFSGGNAYFKTPTDASAYASGVYNEETGLVKFRNCAWFTNVDLDKRHEVLDLYKKYDSNEYPKYDNYDAIEVSKVAEIPMDYDGVMGVPITFLDKYCPEQFEIIGLDEPYEEGKWRGRGPSINGKTIYRRILIKRK